MFELKMMIGEWYCECLFFNAIFICVFKVSLSKPWSRRRFSMICWIFSGCCVEWSELRFQGVFAWNSIWQPGWSVIFTHKGKICDRYFCWGDKLGFGSLKLYSDVCHISVLCNSYFYCTWQIPVSYLRSADPHWMNMTACVWAVLW